jgi:signal transduction histidine kinase
VSPRAPRTLVAAALLAASVAIPCTAWWVMGSRSVERESRDLIAASRAESARAATRLAERVHERLASIERAESRRPYYEYSYRYPDLTKSCECSGWIESPLARGPADPFVAAHFEIDRTLALSLPTMPAGGDPAPADPSPGDGELHARLQRVAPAMWRAAGSGAKRADAVAASWGDVSALVEPFRWHSLAVEGVPQLVALRTVFAPEGQRIQGFLISLDAVRGSFEPESVAAVLRPAAPADRSIVEPLGLAGVDWEVAVSPGGSEVSAAAAADALRRRFHRQFWTGTGAAALAATLVVGLVGGAERLARERSRFAAAAAHELRTPLAGLRLYGDMLAQGLGDPGAGRDYARQIAAEAERLGRVVSNVLGYTRLERGGPLVQLAPVLPADAVREAAERLRPAVESNGARLDVRVEDGIEAIPLDVDALNQIVQNLVDNAERYSREAADRTIRVVLRKGVKSGAVLVVSDHGPGVPPRHRRRLFRPFASGGEPDRPAGLGLGLTLVAALAGAHGGNVSYADAPGGGAEFRVSFPG